MKLVLHRIVIMLAAVTASPASALAVDIGMFLCRSPLIAGNFYSDLLTVQRTGVWVDRAIAEKVAQKNDCRFVASSRLKPVKYVAGELLMTDGTSSGWSDPNLYIIYVNAP